MSDLPERIQKLRARIRRACEAGGRDPGQVELLPVSKRQPLALVREAAEHGFRRFGENYVQEGAQKAQEAPGLEFVLIGPLQRNKARPALEQFREIMTVDRPELAERLRHLAAEMDLQRPVWIQVDLWGEASKLGGCDATGGRATNHVHRCHGPFDTCRGPNRPPTAEVLAHCRGSRIFHAGECPGDILVRDLIEPDSPLFGDRHERTDHVMGRPER